MTALAQRVGSLADIALTATTRMGGKVGVEALSTTLVERFAGSLDDALRHGGEIADAQGLFKANGIGGGAVDEVAALFHRDGIVEVSSLRHMAGSSAGDAVRASELVGLRPAEASAAATVLEHHPAMVGFSAGGTFYRLP